MQINLILRKTLSVLFKSYGKFLNKYKSRNAKKQELKKLVRRNEALKPKIFRDYKTVEELEVYRSKNMLIFQEYNRNLEQIQALKWQLMTPKERIEEENIINLIKLKRQGKLVD